MDRSKLNAIFNEYAGKEIYNPQRMTRDWDPVGDHFAGEVSRMGYRFSFMKKGAAETMEVKHPNAVRAEYEEKDGKFRLTGRYKIGN